LLHDKKSFTNGTAQTDEARKEYVRKPEAIGLKLTPMGLRPSRGK